MTGRPNLAEPLPLPPGVEPSTWERVSVVLGLWLLPLLNTALLVILLLR